ncbi:CorA family magnesium ion transporter [Schizosaccharomyces cryophilus OY26]|uniref:CorA family magnesium ion transporter n=1 Tax=Schizosaccharomyces cryophilus (strain OY26 / ATCC MYA-4695 / CBS 11777 / NBRC 106824 / NRRL Y48691) TaxID=653667 RepID=S9VT23_SCHCR|nr:CorA family magnesium ion transporter [Schizosaccharomyces cryophilus OY26]EPY49280.1 CorA family magnesium ion transporter [Schizosaccharomyces cryophilus OY26]
MMGSSTERHDETREVAGPSQATIDYSVNSSGSDRTPHSSLSTEETTLVPANEASMSPLNHGVTESEPLDLPSIDTESNNAASSTPVAPPSFPTAVAPIENSEYFTQGHHAASSRRHRHGKKKRKHWRKQAKLPRPLPDSEPCAHCSHAKKRSSGKRHRKHQGRNLASRHSSGLIQFSESAADAYHSSYSQHHGYNLSGQPTMKASSEHLGQFSSSDKSSSESLYSISSMSIKNDSNSDSLSSSSSSTDLSSNHRPLLPDENFLLRPNADADGSSLEPPRRSSATKSCSAAMNSPQNLPTEMNTQSDTNLAEQPSRPSVNFAPDTYMTKEDGSASVKSVASQNRDATSHVDSELPRDVEEDVCFPMQEESLAYNGIDFDELDNFASEELQKRMADMVNCRSRQYSVSKPFEPHWKDLSPQRDSTGTSSEAVNDEKQVNKPLKSYISPNRESIGSKAQSPHRFSLFSSGENETIHAAAISDLLEDEVHSFRSLLCAEKGVWWLDCLNPTDSEMRMLSKAFSIHPLTTEDIRVQETREKVELFRSYYFVCFRSFEQDPEGEDYLEPLNMYIIVFREGLLTFHFSSTTHPASVRRRARQLRDYVDVSSDWLCYALIDDITDAFVPLIRAIETETEAIEDSVLVGRLDESCDMLRRIGECRKKTMGMFRLLYGKADVIKMLAKRCNEKWNMAPTGEIGLYLGDIQDHLITMTSNLSQFEKILSRTHSNYLAQLTSNSIEENSRMNSALGKITLIGTLLVPMNLITGLFGMNVPIPGQSSDTNTSLAWFFGIIGVLVALVVIGWFVALRYNAF